MGVSALRELLAQWGVVFAILGSNRFQEDCDLGVVVRIRRWFRLSDHSPVPSDIDRARALIDAIDRGGVPSDPLRVNAIARSLGLDVSRRAPIGETVERIRAAVQRVDSSHLP